MARMLLSYRKQLLQRGRAPNDVGINGRRSRLPSERGANFTTYLTRDRELPHPLKIGTHSIVVSEERRSSMYVKLDSHQTCVYSYVDAAIFLSI